MTVNLKQMATKVTHNTPVTCISLYYHNGGCYNVLTLPHLQPPQMKENKSPRFRQHIYWEF